MYQNRTSFWRYLYIYAQNDVFSGKIIWRGCFLDKVIKSFFFIIRYRTFRSAWINHDSKEWRMHLSSRILSFVLETNIKRNDIIILFNYYIRMRKNFFRSYLNYHTEHISFSSYFITWVIYHNMRKSLIINNIFIKLWYNYVKIQTRKVCVSPHSSEVHIFLYLLFLLM